ncbi:hypothetical protein RND81_10G162100 [Saponaria officinalis]|uniref:Uncharacterized protein n=1 Tax=Saponaria officinalis TaxID=3572 RepID=A0AAW1I3J4_SAPOF
MNNNKKMSESEPLLLSSNKKGGLRTLPFIIVNKAFENVASLGLSPNMIVYLMGSYGMKLTTGSNYIYFWNAAMGFSPVVGAFIADSCVGRYYMIGVGSVFSLLGMIFLWFTAIIPGATPCDESKSDMCGPPNVLQLALLISSFILMSLGAGGVRSSAFPFAADQLSNSETEGSSNIIERVLNWIQFSSGVAAVVAMTVLVYIQENYGWKVGFGVPVAFMVLAVLSFFVASPMYVKVKAKGGSPVSFARVLVAAWKKRHLTLIGRDDPVYHQRKGSRLKIPTDRLRFLDKACIIVNAKEELTLDGTVLHPWRLCEIDQVEELKAIIKVLPILSSCIMVSVNGIATAGVLQARSMNRHLTKNFEVPAGSFGSFLIIVIVLWLIIYDRIIIPVATRIMGKPVHLSPRTRMGIGLLLFPASVAATAIIEGVRREKAIQEGFADNPSGVVDMSAFWLLFHSLFYGIAEAFLVIAQTEFFYSEFPKTMSSVATNIGSLGGSVASLLSSLLMTIVDSITSKGGKDSWVSSNINKGHIDYYHWLLTGLYLLNFLYFLLCSRAYGRSDAQEMLRDDDDEMKDE